MRKKRGPCRTAMPLEQRLQVELINRLGGDELHGRALRSLSYRLGATKIVLLAFRI